MWADSFTLVPVLTQWVVYAIRNLTEDNSQNQDLIAKMEEQGLADTSLLKKMGFEVEKSGNKLILKSATDTPPLVSSWRERNPLSGRTALPLALPLDENVGGNILPHKMAKAAPNLMASNVFPGFYAAAF